METAQGTTLNEDWLKLASWDVRDAAGNVVTELDSLATILGVDRAAAAEQLLAMPAAASAPPELITEAQAELDNDTAGMSLFDGFGADDDGEPGEPPAGGAVPEDEDEDEDDKPFPGAKAFPWQKGGKDKDSADTGSSTRKATIATGAFVSGSFGKGKVEVVVTSGKVPGVDTDVEGTKDGPACRVRVYEETDGSWKATDKRVAVKASGLKTIPPLGAAKFGKKDATAGLVLLVAALDPATDVPAESVRTVFERGTRSWPGEAKTVLSAEQWALGRATAFVSKARGTEILGYVGDDDLLP